MLLVYHFYYFKNILLNKGFFFSMTNVALNYFIPFPTQKSLIKKNQILLKI